MALDFSPPTLDLEGTLSNRDTRAVIGGWLLILTAVLTGVAALARFASRVSQVTVDGSADAISAGWGLFVFSGYARLFSGVALVATSRVLRRTWMVTNNLESPWTFRLFSASGQLTVLSGMATILVGMVDPAPEAANSNATLSSLVEYSELTRWITADSAFALAGVGLIVAARSQWGAGGGLQLISPFSVLVGVAMQFIWIDSASMVHPVVGAAFLLWLLAIGVMLLTGRTERLFAGRAMGQAQQ